VIGTRKISLCRDTIGSPDPAKSLGESQQSQYGESAHRKDAREGADAVEGFDVPDHAGLIGDGRRSSREEQ
jgi:hypothetical protein